MAEADSYGLDQHQPGAKLDKGKVRMSLITRSMPRALTLVGQVGTFGAVKYTDGGWLEVPNGYERYTDADERHGLKIGMGELTDLDSGLLHQAHKAWNSLAALELLARELEDKGFDFESLFQISLQRAEEFHRKNSTNSKSLV